jgi:hypothetical protein
MKRDTFTSDTKRDAILGALALWITQRPGLEYGNYSSGWNDKAGRAAYFAESRCITRQRRDAGRMLATIAWRTCSIDADALLKAFRAFARRLTVTLTQGDGGHWTATLDYVTGQYWPTEYRAAVCAILGTALFDSARASALSAGHEQPGTVARQVLRREFGRLQSHWMD